METRDFEVNFYPGATWTVLYKERGASLLFRFEPALDRKSPTLVDADPVADGRLAHPYWEEPKRIAVALERTREFLSSCGYNVEIRSSREIPLAVPPTGRMMSAEFAKMVESAFAPLFNQYGFRLTNATTYYCPRFESQEVVVTVCWEADRLRYMGLSIGLRAGSQFELCQLTTLGKTGLPPTMPEIIAREPREVAPALAQLADVLSVYGRDALRGDRWVFACLDVQRDRHSYLFLRLTPVEAASQKALVAWLQQDYAAVVALLKPFVQALTPSESRLLREAESRCGSSRPN